MKTLGPLCASLLLVTATSATQASDINHDSFDHRVTLGATASIFGIGPSLSWRFHENLGVTARYTDGFTLPAKYNSENMDYDGDPDLSSSSLTLDYFPTGKSFYLTAGVMQAKADADIAAERLSGLYNVNGTIYSARDVGDIRGELKFFDNVQPYVGVGARHSYRSGFAFFSELGIVPTNVNVSLSSSSQREQLDGAFASDLRDEEESLRDNVDRLPVMPMAFIGVGYTW